MRRLVILFGALVAIFFTSWGVKAGMPIARPSNIHEETKAAWYENGYSSPNADSEWFLEAAIDADHIPVPGQKNVYMWIGEDGTIKGYYRADKQGDGSIVWTKINPDIPEDYEAVEGLEDVYKVTDKDGNVSYVQYVRNDDNSFCFVPVNKNGVPLDDGSSAEKIDSEKYVPVEGNVYAMYNDDKVLMGYRERTKDTNGNYIWKVADAPERTASNETSFKVDNKKNNGSSNTSGDSGTTVLDNTDKIRKENGDGTYTLTETSTETRTEGNYAVTYQTVIIKKYNTSTGELLETRNGGTTEISRKPIGAVITQDPSGIAIESTLNKEYARVNGEVSFNTQKEDEVLAKLNAQRKSEGLPELKMDRNGDIYKIACLRVADMALYDHSSEESRLYGTIDELLQRYGVTVTDRTENAWAGNTGTSATDIHKRYQANDGSRNARMSNGFSTVGIAIVERNGKTYISEILAN